MKYLNKAKFLICFLLILRPTLGWSNFSLSMVGAGNYSALNGSNGGISGAAALGFGGGLLLGLPFNDQFKIEVGGLFIPETNSAVNANMIDIPVLFRFSFIPSFSIGLGGYYGLILNSPATLQSFDYGVMGSLAYLMPLGSSFSFLIDGRYSLGLSNVGVTGTSNYGGVIGLVGFQIGI